jgi:hypothetical protein
MRLSLFTPTNTPKYLSEVYLSVQAQNFPDIEWVIVPNGDVRVEDIPAEIRANPRVRIVPYAPRDSSNGIGALKRFCCEQCTGDVFIELDHDDLLVPGVLPLIADKVSEGADFVYSDTGYFRDETLEQEPPYSPAHGWESYPFRIYGREFVAMRNFPITPRSLCEIYYCPDHVRAWTRKSYDAMQGHDATLHVCDDHDLMCRTYLSGFRFAHTGTVGYLYRKHADQSYLRFNDDIQVGTLKLRERYLHRLIDRWINTESLPLLDLAAPGTLALNKSTLLKLPAEDNSVGCVRAYHMLHRLPHSQITALMEEIYRVLVPGGWLCAYVGSTDGHLGFAPDVCSWWNTRTFECYTNRELAQSIGGHTARFQMVQCKTDRPTPMPAVAYAQADMCALKGQRQPGLVWI